MFAFVATHVSAAQPGPGRSRPGPRLVRRHPLPAPRVVSHSNFEPVYSVNEWYDNPRAGFAEFNGQPHVFTCPWNETNDDYSTYYELSPVSAELAAAAREDWTIFRRWQAAMFAGEVERGTGPALPSDQARQKQLWSLIEGPLNGVLPVAHRAYGEFRRVPNHDTAIREPADLEVRWTLLADAV